MPLVQAAVLAANAHNTQPWIFELGPDQIDLFADTSRNIGALDPLRREMHMSLGCALENLVLAAQAAGYAPSVQLLPTGNESLVARVALARAPRTDSVLYRAIPLRHTNRGPYAGRPIERTVLDFIAALNDAPEVTLIWVAEPAKQRFSDLTIEAARAIIADEKQAADDFVWFRQDWDDLQQRKDGITTDAAGLADVIRIAAKILPPQSRTGIHRAWLNMARTRQLPTAAAFGILAVRERDSPAQRMQAGRLWQRVHLLATTRGLAMQPLAQTVERADRERSAGLTPVFTGALQEFTSASWHAVLPFRIGYPTMTPLRSPRRPASEVTRSR